MTDIELLVLTAESFCKTLQTITDNEVMFCENLTQLVQDATYNITMMKANLQEIERCVC